jgi:carboxylesterase type B
MIHRAMKFVVLTLAFLHRVSAQGGLTVTTAQGPVSGTLVLPTVRQFLGIPFATAERWQAPQLPPVHSSVSKATSFGDSCPQGYNAYFLEFITLANAGGVNVSSSENCLSVNIWAPSTDRKQQTAVMIWIYGGGFTFGTVSNIIVINNKL